MFILALTNGASLYQKSYPIEALQSSKSIGTLSWFSKFGTFPAVQQKRRVMVST
jgi:hypothetical protein